MAGFLLILVDERVSGIKHLQTVCGMNKLVYWLCAYVWDMVWYSVFCMVMVTLFFAMKNSDYTDRDELPVVILILLCYGLAVIPWIYMLSFLFTSPATAYVILFCLNFLSGFAFIMVDAIIIQLEGLSDKQLLHYKLVWVPFPAYALGRSMMYFSMDKPLQQYISAFTFEPTDNPYFKLAPFFASLLVQCIIYSTVVLLIELSPHITKAM